MQSPLDALFAIEDAGAFRCAFSRGLAAALAAQPVYLCPLYREGTKVNETTEKIYLELTAAGVEVLFDDRQESPGVKFNDADLYGFPLRITVSPRTLEKESVEVKWRHEKAFVNLPLEGLTDAVKKLLDGRSGA